VLICDARARVNNKTSETDTITSNVNAADTQKFPDALLKFARDTSKGEKEGETNPRARLRTSRMSLTGFSSRRIPIRSGMRVADLYA